MESTRNKLVRVKISSIILYDEAIKEYDLKLFEKLKRSIKKRGQLKNIVICESENGFECLEGSKTIMALKELDEESVVAYNLGVLSEEDKKIIRIELFRDYFLTNYVFIGKLLKEISETVKLDDVCNTIPFDIRQAKHLINMHNFDWDGFSQNKQLEGQSSLFDVFESNEIVEDLKVEGTDIQNEIKIEKKQETIIELKTIFEKNADSVPEIVEKILEDVIEKSIEESSDIFNTISIETKVIEDTDFDNLIDKEDKVESETLSNEIIEIESEKIKDSPKVKTNSIVNQLGDEIKINDTVLFQTQRKGEFKITVTKYTPKWVYYIEVSTGKETYVEMDKFIKLAKRINENSSDEVVESKANEKEVEVNQEIKKVEEPKLHKVVEGNTFDETNFYVDPKSNLLIIKKFNKEIVLALNKLCLERSEVKFKTEFKKCEIESKDFRNGETHIVCVYCLTDFGNKMSLPLSEVLDIIKTIDLKLFEKETIETESFHFDYDKKVLVLKNNKQTILDNIPLIAKKILDGKWNTNAEEDKIEITSQEEGENTIISHISYKTAYGVPIRVMLNELGEYLMKIDFDLN